MYICEKMGHTYCYITLITLWKHWILCKYKRRLIEAVTSQGTAANWPKPKCLIHGHRMRSLELAGTAGLVVIIAVMGIILYQSVHTGMPAIQSGEMPLWTVKVFTSNTPLPVPFLHRPCAKHVMAPFDPCINLSLDQNRPAGNKQTVETEEEFDFLQTESSCF